MNVSLTQDTLGNSTQFFYADPARPSSVSHVFWPKRGALTSLLYDDLDRLIFADVGSGSQQVQLHQVCSCLSPLALKSV